MMQASKANESVSECSKTVLYLTVRVLRIFNTCHEETHESHLNVTGVQFFRLQMNRNLTQFRP